ncbi:uracil-DNA glycosylase [Azohydromonas aeria]|uniref:uracil-DNA glycosylase n=1 Tax=Azohydromonas aeria TaxID=2590212 RepID=UPI0012FA26B1
MDMPSLNRLQPPLESRLQGVDPGWQAVVDAWLESLPGQALVGFVDQRLAAGATVFPARPLRALELTPLPEVKVVLLGQDPYHGVGQAEGLAFSVPEGVAPPPSLRNVFKELQRDLGLRPPRHGHLVGWAQRGVLLLNTTLTVEEGKPASHAKRGWEALTDALIQAAAAEPSPKVFMLWGAHAQAKRPLVEAAGGEHLVLVSNHPSPLAATKPPLPFIGCGHFGLASAYLAERGRAIDWQL